MALRDVKLNDKYDLGHRHVFVTGFQALVRLCLMQKELDRRNGLNTAGYVTGYRGSPLGGLDGQKLGETVVASADFAAHFQGEFRRLGEHTVAGFAATQTVFGLAN